jgi:septal ring factor EnvC (AmiA/AmiB activator)
LVTTIESLRGGIAELTEKLENATMMLTARSTELERSQKIGAEMSATVAQQREEIRDLTAQGNADRRNIDELKSRLFRSGQEVARLTGHQERAAELDSLRLAAIGRVHPSVLNHGAQGRTLPDGAITGAAPRPRWVDDDWILF